VRVRAQSFAGFALFAAALVSAECIGDASAAAPVRVLTVTLIALGALTLVSLPLRKDWKL
jgi:hypothetical protein